MTNIRNVAHDLLAVLGLLLAMQAPITAYLVGFGVQGKVIDLGFGGMGLAVTLLSKLIDSRSYTAQQVAAIQSHAVAVEQPPVAPGAGA